MHIPLHPHKKSVFYEHLGLQDIKNYPGMPIDLKVFISQVNNELKRMPLSTELDYWFEHIVLTENPNHMIIFKHYGVGYTGKNVLVMVQLTENESITDNQIKNSISNLPQFKGNEAAGKALASALIISIGFSNRYYELAKSINP